MKRAFGLAEILIVGILILTVYLICFHQKYGRSNPFSDNEKINSQQQLVDEKLKDIEKSKELKQRIENNLNKGF